jgi:hypothetical protein
VALLAFGEIGYEGGLGEIASAAVRLIWIESTL